MPHHPHIVQTSRLARLLTVTTMSVLLSACASQAMERAPASSDAAWKGMPPQYQDDSTSTTNTLITHDTGFAVPAMSVLAMGDLGPQLDSEREYDLLSLIDIAQRANPATRIAWNHAREAALSVGMVEASFLPMISANVIAGVQRMNTPAPLANLIGPEKVRVTARGTIPFISLGWLLFDFGGRAAIYEGAEQLSFAANVLFNAAHQKVIRDVTDFYYQYDAARHHTELTQQGLKNHQAVEQAAVARFNEGLGTRVELAVAKQAVAQAQLRVVLSQGHEKNAYLALLDAVGVKPTSKIKIASVGDQALPGANDPLTEKHINAALTQRADLAAAYAALKAADAGVKVAESQFFPKIYLGAALGKHHSRLSTPNLPIPDLHHQSAATGVMVGITMPIFDGGLRRAALRKAEVARDSSATNLASLQKIAVREIVAAETVLNSALQAHSSAVELVATADTAYDAAFSAYKAGLGTITIVNEMANAVLVAKEAEKDAHNAALIAAANLAFVMGEMNQAQAQWVSVF